MSLPRDLGGRYVPVPTSPTDTYTSADNTPAAYQQMVEMTMTNKIDLDWMCGAFEPVVHPRLQPYRCSEPFDHAGDHQAEVDGVVKSVWPRARPARRRWWHRLQPRWWR